MALERFCPLESEGLNFIKVLVNTETSGGIYISLGPLDFSHKSFEMTGWVLSMLLSLRSPLKNLSTHRALVCN